MPGFIKTKRDEELWDKAKERAAEEGKKDNYAYITGIYKKMKGGKVADDRVVSLANAWMRKRATGWADPKVNDILEVVKGFKADTTVPKRLPKGTRLRVMGIHKGHNRNMMWVRDEAKGMSYTLKEDWDLDKVKVVPSGPRLADLNLTKKQMDELHDKGTVEVDGETLTYKGASTMWTVYLFSNKGKILFQSTYPAKDARDADRRGLRLVKPHLDKFDDAEDWVVEPAQQ